MLAPMQVRLRTAASRLPAAVVGALATHALVYRSFWPSDGMHGYFGWYEPAVGIASLVALVGSVLALVVVVAARRAGRPIPSIRTRRSIPLSVRARSASVASLLFLLTQESLERSVAAGHPAVAQFQPSEWLLLAAGIATVSFLLAGIARACEFVIGRAIGVKANPRRRGSVRAFRRPSGTVAVRRSHPLANGLGLRAPPLLSS
jgi:hypothetical protein